MTAEPPVPARSGFGRVLLLGALFFAPLVAAVLLYQSGWRPVAGTQHGMLVEPPRRLPDVELATAGGVGVRTGALRGTWTLVYLGDGACSPRCMAALDDLRRVHLALDRDAARVRRVFLYTGRCCRDGFPGPDQSGLRALGIGGPDGAALLAQFPLPAASGDGIYVIDPLGNLILGYPAAGAARGLLADLERLLRLSRIG